MYLHSHTQTYQAPHIPVGPLCSWLLPVPSHLHHPSLTHFSSPHHALALLSSPSGTTHIHTVWTIPGFHLPSQHQSAGSVPLIPLTYNALGHSFECTNNKTVAGVAGVTKATKDTHRSLLIFKEKQKNNENGKCTHDIILGSLSLIPFSWLTASMKAEWAFKWHQADL